MQKIRLILKEHGWAHACVHSAAFGYGVDGVIVRQSTLETLEDIVWKFVKSPEQ